MTVEAITDHQAFSCECGSVTFNLLRSGRIECVKCGTLLKAEWRQLYYLPKPRMTMDRKGWI